MKSRTDGHDAIDASRASLTSQSSTETSPNPFNPVECSYTPFPAFTARPTLWTRQIPDPFVTTPFPFRPLSEQLSEPLQDYNRGANEYDQNHHMMTPAPAPTVTLPLFNSMYGNDHDIVSYMNGMELSQMHLDSWPSETPTSTFQQYTHQHQNPYPHGYVPQSSASTLHGQHQPTSLAAEQSLSLPVTQQITNEWDGSQNDSASQEDSNGI